MDGKTVAANSVTQPRKRAVQSGTIRHREWQPTIVTAAAVSVAILDGALPFEMAQLGACAVWMARGTTDARLPAG